MYDLEDKLAKKYKGVLPGFSPEFLDCIHELNAVRRAQRELQPFTRNFQPLGKKQEEERLYYILDASAILHLYVIDEDLTPKLDHFVEQKGLGRAFLFVPNFCVAETFNTFAKFYYRWKSLTPEQYSRCTEAFKHDIHNGHLLYHYELNRYHVLNVDYIIPFEHLFEPKRPKGVKKGEEWTLSTFDILIIALGMELARITGGRTYIVTCDRRLHKITQVLLGLSTQQRAQQGIPGFAQFPHSVFLREKKLVELPYVEGQKVDV
ncbi:MAG: hypothetical protein LAP13_00215 [Acidobacteriia bacterium]|nr:hypothetical protein [Terriglobia bacterium]